MPRKLRVQYPGAIYHLMNRGDRREKIFKDDLDRNRFLATSATPSNPLTYDPVWPPPGICLDGNAVFNGLYDGINFCPPGINGPEPQGTFFEYVNFCADDYTCSAADALYFYFAWCDRARIDQNTRPDCDIKFARVKQ